MSVSVFEHPFLRGLLGDPDSAAQFSADADVTAMIAFEIALARAQAVAGLIPDKPADDIVDQLVAFRPDVDALDAATARDGVVVAELVRQMRKAVGGDAAEFVHFGATSQDVIDTSLAMRLREVAKLLDTRLDTLDAALSSLLERDGDVEVMAHTRMQAAIRVNAGRKIASWRDPLLRGRTRLAEASAQVAVLTLGGAAGTTEKFASKADAVAAAMAGELGLGNVPRARHSERDGIVAFASALSLVTGVLGKMGADIALAAQSEVGEIRLAAGGGSSAMPHKVNPVGAEILVTLARFNATLVSGMHQSLVHENERSGAAWTLEWMLLPQMAVACGAALRTAISLVGGLSFVALPKKG